MSAYKVIQDIEAEDKLLGPLTFRQFVYGLICALCLYFCFLVVTKGAAFMLIVFLPPAVFCGFFAFPFRADQSTEVWALAKIRFFFKPRKRIWDQSGIKELVSITVPKTVEVNRTDGLSQIEVKSRLQALADTIDTRGWAVKNIGSNLYNQPLVVAPGASSDRLIDYNSMPQDVSSLDIRDGDDILDAQTSPVSQHFDEMMASSAKQHRQQIVQQLNQPAPPAPSVAAATKPPADYWFLSQPTGPAAPKKGSVQANAQVVFPGEAAEDSGVAAATPTPDEAALAAQLKEQNREYEQHYRSHLKTIQPLGTNPVPPTPPPASDSATKTPEPPVTDTPDPAILNLANNDDLDVATLARQANKAKQPKKEPPEDEVVISLH